MTKQVFVRLSFLNYRTGVVLADTVIPAFCGKKHFPELGQKWFAVKGNLVRLVVQHPFCLADGLTRALIL